MKLVNYHFHIFPQFIDNLEDYIQKASTLLKYGIVVSINYENSIQNINLTSKYNNIDCAIGIHPIFEANHINPSKVNEIEDLLIKYKDYIWGLGEIGLDFRVNNPVYSFIKKNGPAWKFDKQNQIKIFTLQMELAKKYSLPVNCHTENSEREFYEIISNFKDVKVYIHNYHYSPKWTKKYLELENVFFGFNLGTIKFENIVDVIKLIPQNRIFVENEAYNLCNDGDYKDEIYGYGPWSVESITRYLEEAKDDK